MNPYQNLVSEFARFTVEGKAYPLGGFPPAPRPELAPDAPTVLVFSPHPDDECVVGGLALRLLREARMRVVNVAVTQGSNPARQTARYAELQAACGYLGFDLVQTQPNGLTEVNPVTRQRNPPAWQAMVQVITAILVRHQPHVVFFPHDRDWNSTHIGTHYLVMDALRGLGNTLTCHLVETEFWGPMDTPNLMVELSVPDVTDLVTATSFHVGEVQRNPYHLLLPASLLDNVRRGGELVGGQGHAAPSFTFAILYRLRRWTEGQIMNCDEGGRNLPLAANAGGLLKRAEARPTAGSPPS